MHIQCHAYMYVNQLIGHSYGNRIITQLNGSHIPLTSDEALFVPSDNKMPNSVFSCLRICEQQKEQVNKTGTIDSPSFISCTCTLYIHVTVSKNIAFRTGGLKLS